MGHAGRLLVATPLIGDPTFERTVVLLLAHGDEGAFGLVVNRPSDTSVLEVAAPWADRAAAPGVVFVGGPVTRDTVIGVAALGPVAGPGYSPVVGGIGTVDLNEPPGAVHHDGPGVRLFAGSAGWAPGQLEDEIREGAWWPVDAEPGDPFAGDPAGLWAAVLRRQPGQVAWFANCPTDPSAN